MNKKLLAVMIGTALAGSMSIAQADVQLYGQVDVSVDSHDCGNGGCVGYSAFKGYRKNDDSQKMNMYGNFSYLGVKGSEDLGNGLKAIFNVMFAYDPAGSNSSYGGSSSSNTLNENEAWLGLASDFGTFRAGTVTTPYSDHGAMIDPFFGTSLEGNKSGLQSNFLHDEYNSGDFANGLSSRTVRLDSADYNGLSGSLFYTLGGGTNNNGNNKDNAYGLGVQYKNGNILAFTDYLTDGVNYVVGVNSFNGTDDKAWDVGGQYTWGNIGLFGMYERGGLLFGNISSIAQPPLSFLNSHESGASIWHLGGSYKMGNTLAYLAYGQGDPNISDSNDNDKYTTWTLGVKHSLSVRTSVYAGYTNTDVDNNIGKTDQFGVGMNVKF